MSRVRHTINGNYALNKGRQSSRIGIWVQSLSLLSMPSDHLVKLLTSGILKTLFKQSLSFWVGEEVVGL